MNPGVVLVQTAHDNNGATRRKSSLHLNQSLTGQIQCAFCGKKVADHAKMKSGRFVPARIVLFKNKRCLLVSHIIPLVHELINQLLPYFGVSFLRADEAYS